MSDIRAAIAASAMTGTRSEALVAATGATSRAGLRPRPGSTGLRVRAAGVADRDFACAFAGRAAEAFAETALRFVGFAADFRAGFVAARSACAGAFRATAGFAGFDADFAGFAGFAAGFAGFAADFARFAADFARFVALDLGAAFAGPGADFARADFVAARAIPAS